MQRASYENDLIPLESLLEEKLRLRTGHLRDRLSKARYRLPRRLRKDVEFILQADYMTRNPHLAIMVSETRFQGAVRAISAYLADLDPAQERKNRLLNLAALIALYVLMTGAGVVGVMVWRDLV
ncbi:hypothetical protein QQG91_03155 [Marivivens sp. LCG002]|uniref:hypothetical protein n=1 Tax=Marivivens sp. LCG002 TaxID=3051171 RepID=UPI002552BA17|nr:hypothetical protein [Marivivens sp. LCG002]WIV51461.1 hypothetical protein QQG91_03155 [Marivivens sp. LCG002]